MEQRRRLILVILEPIRTIFYFSSCSDLLGSLWRCSLRQCSLWLCSLWSYGEPGRTSRGGDAEAWYARAGASRGGRSSARVAFALGRTLHLAYFSSGHPFFRMPSSYRALLPRIPILRRGRSLAHTRARCPVPPWSCGFRSCRPAMPGAPMTAEEIRLAQGQAHELKAYAPKRRRPCSVSC